jgi:hypothetical protein
MAWEVQMKVMLLAACTLVCGVVLASEQEAPQYVRFTFADPDFDQRDPLYEVMHVDENRGTVFFDDLGLPLAPCRPSWNCFSLAFVTLAVPQRCEQLGSDGTWRYEGRTFKPVGVLDTTVADARKVRHVVEVVGQSGKRESVAILSRERGLESFAMVEDSDQDKLFVHYYLTSPEGVLTGGCVSRSTEDD